MATLLELNRRAKKIDTDKIFGNALQSNSKNVIQALQDQLYKGITAGYQGNEYSFRYNPKNKSYIEKKRSMNPSAGGKVDFKLTGSFYKGMTLIKENNTEFYINSSDEKTGLLKDRYGNNLMGLTKNTSSFVGERYIKLAMQQGLRKILGI